MGAAVNNEHYYGILYACHKLAIERQRMHATRLKREVDTRRLEEKCLPIETAYPNLVVPSQLTLADVTAALE